MSAKTSHTNLLLGAALLIVLLVAMILANDASAAASLEKVSNSCLTCHEDQYYLHDIGQISCITEHADRCVNCHEGNAESMKKDISHLGLLVHPQENDGQKCQQCHPEDTEARLAAYASTGGYQKVIKAEPYKPPVVQQTHAIQSMSRQEQRLETLPWFIGSILAFGLWLVLVLFSPQKP